MIQLSDVQQLPQFATHPILVARAIEGSQNNHVAFLNEKFITTLGYTMEDIPDKETWWQKAYPDPSYRKVVEAQWELLFQEAIEQDASSISMEVDIWTKFHGERRFNVQTEVKSLTIPDHFVVTFEACEPEF